MLRTQKGTTILTTTHMINPMIMDFPLVLGSEALPADFELPERGAGSRKPGGRGMKKP